jgi:hypothetical protein
MAMPFAVPIVEGLLCQRRLINGERESEGIREVGRKTKPLLDMLFGLED